MSLMLSQIIAHACIDSTRKIEMPTTMLGLIMMALICKPYSLEFWGLREVLPDLEMALQKSGVRT